MANPWDNDPIVSPAGAGPTVTPLPMSPKDRAREGRDISASNRDDIRTGIAVRGEDRDIGYKKFEQVSKWSDDFNTEPTVKSYRVAVQELAKALDTGDGPQADLALTYAFAKAMDPESVVREAEQGMVAGSQPWLEAAAEKIKKQFGMDGAGSFTPEARAALRSQIINSVEKRARLYDQRRNFYSERAERYGFEPQDIVGEHDALPFLDQFKAYDQTQNQSGGDIYTVAGPGGKKIEFTVPPGASDDEIRELGIAATRNPALKGSPVNRPPSGGGEDYRESYMGQGMSGVNEGLASTLGFPVDAMTAGLNLIPQGINALANTDLPQIEDPFLGSQWVKDRMGGSTIYDPSNDPSKQFARRVGQSVGAAAVPAGFAGSLPRAGAALLSGAGGGLGGATAQQVAPGNIGAEIAGEMLGGGMAGAGLYSSARRAAQREIEAAVPTVPQLQDQAGDLYRQAEARGVTADPMMTQNLADNMRDVLRRDGRVSPTGRMADVYPKAREGMQLVEDYAGQPMNPTQMNTVRKIIAEGMSSPDANERRIGSMMTDEFDNFANPLAPEFGEARDIASRYLTAQQLEQARELAGARAGQFTGSGFENALRTEYRGLDRGAIKGTKRFNEDVTGAIETVSRGTPTSNLARGLGRLAPTGPVSFGTGTMLPAMAAGSASGSPGIGAAVGAGMAGIGTLGRMAATGMGIRSADIAELIARNGGALPQAQIGGPELEQLTAALAAAESAKYLPEKKEKRRGMFGR